MMTRKEFFKKYFIGIVGGWTLACVLIGIIWTFFFEASFFHTIGIFAFTGASQGILCATTTYVFWNLAQRLYKRSQTNNL